MRINVRLLATILPLLFFSEVSLADDRQAQRSLVNRGSVGIIAGSITGTDLRLAADLATAFNDGYEVRVLPIVGEGSVRNIEDLLYLKGIDIAIVQSDVLDFYQKSGAVEDIEERINYIAKLHDEEVHVLAHKDIRSVDELAGRFVNLGREGSGTFLTGSLIFDELGINIEARADPQQVAMSKLREGRITALVFVDGAPINLVEGIGPDEPFRLLSIPSERITGAYLPAELTSAMYPNLIDGGAIETVAIGEVLAAYNFEPGHERRNKMSRFIDRFFAQFEKLRQSPYHEKWRAIDLTTEVPNWNRLPAAEKWLSANGRSK